MADASLPGPLTTHYASVKCLNEDEGRNVQAMLKGAEALASDCDEQLLLHFHFQPDEPCRVSHVRFRSPAEAPAGGGGGAAAPGARFRAGETAKQLPKLVKVYLNAPTLDFDAAEKTQPAAEGTLTHWMPTAGDPSVVEAVLAVPRGHLTTASHAAVFVAANASGGAEDVTLLGGVELLGELAPRMAKGDAAWKSGDPRVPK